MKYFRFIGDPKRGGEGPETITAYGLVFGRGKPTAVEDEAIAKRLAGNGHYQEMVPDAVEDDEPTVEDDEPAPKRRGRPPANPAS